MSINWDDEDRLCGGRQDRPLTRGERIVVAVVSAVVTAVVVLALVRA